MQTGNLIEKRCAPQDLLMDRWSKFIHVTWIMSTSPCHYADSEKPIYHNKIMPFNHSLLQFLSSCFIQSSKQIFWLTFWRSVQIESVKSIFSSCLSLSSSWNASLSIYRVLFCDDSLLHTCVPFADLLQQLLWVSLVLCGAFILINSHIAVWKESEREEILSLTIFSRVVFHWRESTAFDVCMSCSRLENFNHSLVVVPHFFHRGEWLHWFPAIALSHTHSLSPFLLMWMSLRARCGSWISKKKRKKRRSDQRSKIGISYITLISQKEEKRNKYMQK